MTVVLTIFAIGALIALHELGHLWAARRVGLPVKRFSIGMGPILYRRQARGIEWAISAIPFGGYVLFDAEDPAYGQAPPLAHIFTSAAGPLANVLVAGVLFVAAASLDAGAFALADGLNRAGASLGSVFDVLGMLFSGQVGVGDLAGPVHMVSQGADLAGRPSVFLGYVAFISLDLAVLNLLPIPSLDGGRILMTAYEALTDKRLPQGAQLLLLGTSSLLLVGLMVWVMVQDVVRLFS